MTVMTAISIIYLPGNGGNTFHLEFALSKNEFMALVNQLGPEALIAYKNLLLIDSIFPFAYSIFFASIIALLSSKKEIEVSEKTLFFFTLPLIGCILDLIENISHLFLLSDLSSVTDSRVIFSAIISITKWSMPVISTLYILFMLGKITLAKSFFSNSISQPEKD
jgi:hypothetical protein